jgi:hypothetical protein
LASLLLAGFRSLDRDFNLHLVRRHFYSPIADRADSADSSQGLISELSGDDVNESATLDPLDTGLPACFEELPAASSPRATESR